MKRFFCLMLCLLMIVSAAQAQEKVDHLPAALLFTQKQTDRINLNKQCYGQRMYPKTALKSVDAEMEQLIDAMYDRALPSIPTQAGKSSDPSYLTVGANITRTGVKWLSFLSTARIDHDRRQTYVDFDARVYDMETGARVTLGDVFPASSIAWSLLGSAVREQLSNYFLGTEPNAAVLDQLCTKEALMQTPFTLTPACLRLHYRADVLYPGHEQLMHVRLYYNNLRPFMTPEAKAQTDNSCYKMIALTFDDGVSHYDTAAVADRMRMYGAQVTFFVVGRTIKQNQDLLAANHDAGHLVGSHNYQHVYDGLTTSNILSWKEQYDTELNEAIGLRPIVMRAPGGVETPYARAGVGMPVFHWSNNPSDAGSDQVQQIIRSVTNNAKDGDIVLMHDLNKHAREYAPEIVKILTERGFLCVSMDEMFAAADLPMLPNTVYISRDKIME